MTDFYVPPEKSLINETVVRPGELITSVFVPAPEPGTRSAYQKYGEKESFDWPLADAGVVLVMDGNRCKKASIVLGVAAPTPLTPSAPKRPGRQDYRRALARAAAGRHAGSYATLAKRLQNTTLRNRHLPHRTARCRTDAARPKRDWVKKGDLDVHTLYRSVVPRFVASPLTGNYGDFHEELVELMGATTTYWCLRTMTKAGPDEHYVHRSICQQGRSCWHEPAENV